MALEALAAGGKPTDSSASYATVAGHMARLSIMRLTPSAVIPQNHVISDPL